MIDKLLEIIYTYMRNSFDVNYQKLHGNFAFSFGETLPDILLFNSQPENITEAICRQLTEFTRPVYLALFDESQRLNSDPDLTKLLLNVSVALNSTLEMARYLVSNHKRLDFHAILCTQVFPCHHLWRQLMVAFWVSR